ncbi:hypothetical protein ACFQO7_26600 [Catellatospora aurea]|uniref:Abortive infection Abi-like protein n=1 Tax=Catellatospora aurea TaxID=1337874 RepID=A0ABW2H2F9_9ACTN
MNATDPWAPLSRRIAGQGPDATYHDGIPSYLRDALEHWVDDCYPADGYQIRRLEGTLKLRLRVDSIGSLSGVSDTFLLDVIDALLAWEVEPGKWRFDQLNELLTAGGAGWRIRSDGTGLERRLDETVTQAAATAVTTAADDAAEHLRGAWNGAYGLHPDPDRAYDEAVLAVEAVACPLVCPANPRGTLGRVIADLGNQRDQWALSIANTSGQPSAPGALIEMLKVLWHGQSRHAGSPNSRRQTQAEAEAAVHLAATLVQWLNSGVLYKP